MPTQTIDMNNVTSVSFNNQAVSKIKLNGNIIFPQPQNTYIYIYTSDQGGFTLETANNTKNWDGTIETSTDNVTWNTWDGTSSVSSSNDGKLYIRGNNNTYISRSSGQRWVFTTNNSLSYFYIENNIESLLDNITVGYNEHPVMANQAFCALFYGMNKLKGVSTNLLGAVILSTQCYYQMFYGCTLLENTPNFPATTLAPSCYAYMFVNCSMLGNVSPLTATTLATSCYAYMFNGSFSNAPNVIIPPLTATTLASSCYDSMFRSAKITTAPAILATVMKSSCCSNMFNNCTQLTTVPPLTATTLASSCFANMFNGCTNLVTPPSISAIGTAPTKCFSQMFMGCTKLTSLPAIRTTTIYGGTYTITQNKRADGACYQMFKGCSKIKMSSTQVNDYTRTYKFPYSGSGSTTNGSIIAYEIFNSTGGTYTGNATINTTYYTSNTIVT